MDQSGQGTDRAMALGDGHILRGCGMTSGRMAEGMGSSPSGARTALVWGNPYAKRVIPS